MFVKYVNGNGEVKIVFFGVKVLDLLQGLNVESIIKKLLDFFVECKFFMNFMFSFVLDGVLVMIGKNFGVVVRLKNLQLILILFYCICYKFVFVNSDVDYFLKFVKNIVINFIIVWKFFENSFKCIVIFIYMQKELC